MKKLLTQYYWAFMLVPLLGIYFSTIAPGVLQIDSGELAASMYNLGVPHATGYPLFVLLGWLWLQLPLGYSPIFQANVFALLCTAIGVTVFSGVIRLLLIRFFTIKIPNKQKKQLLEHYSLNPLQASIIAIIVGVTFGTLPTIWFQSVGVEVYSLHLLLISLILWAGLRAHLRSDAKSWLLLGVMVGLGFCNHLSTLMLLPALAYLFFSKEWGKPSMLLKAGLTAGAAFLVLVIGYAFLSYRALQYPLPSWGNVVNWDNFFYHVTGRQFQVWVFSGMDAFKNHFFGFLKNVFTSPVLLLCLMGVFFIRGLSKDATWFVWLLFAMGVFIASNYDIVDIDNYFIAALAGLAFFLAAFLSWLLSWLTRKGYSQYWLLVIGAAAVLINTTSNHSKLDQSDVHTFEEYTNAMLEAVPDSAIILTKQWDYFISPSYYSQFVEQKRRDVSIIDRELLRRRWYYPQLYNMDASLRPLLQAEQAAFSELVQPFDKGEAFDQPRLEAAFQAITTKILLQADKRPVYMAPELVQGELSRGEINLPTGYMLIPENLLYRLVKRGKPYELDGTENMEVSFPENDETNEYAVFIKDFYYQGILWRAMYDHKMSRMERAKKLGLKAKSLKPQKQLPMELAQLVG